MGSFLHDTGKLDAAIEAYKKAISIKPDYAEAYYNMGNAFQEQGNLEEALEAYKEAVLIKPDYAEAYNNMGVTLKDQGNLEEALKSCNKAHELNPDFYNQMALSELILLHRKDASSALALLESALLKNPTDTRAIAYKTIALRGLKRFKEVEKLINFPTLVKNENIQKYTNMDIADFNNSSFIS